MENRNNTDFQTPPIVAGYMASLIPVWAKTILEPTPGAGNLVRAAENKKRTIVAPPNFEEILKFDSKRKFDCVIMNPPFTPMERGYWFLTECMKMSNNIVALLPWFIIINSEKRLKAINEFGLVSVTHLPRKTFPGTRIQCCVLEMKRNFRRPTIFRIFE